MASCKFEGGKCKGSGDVKAALRHNDVSPEMRAVAAKGNPDIDLPKAGLNVRLWGGSYAERCAAYDARIAELDAQPGANLRKDRVTGQLIETPVPTGLPRSKYNAWMRRVVEIQVARYGAKNVISADGHWDEEHEYIGDDGKPTMSRVHVQTVVVPEVAGRLCGKEFFSRRAMRELNDAVQEMSISEFGVQFMDGSKKKGTKSTEQLKAESARKATEAAQKASEAILEQARGEAARMRQDAQSAAEARLRAAEAEADKVRGDAAATISQWRRSAKAQVQADQRVAQQARDAAQADRAAQQAELTRLRAVPTPISSAERQMLEVAKQIQLSNGQTMYSYLQQRVRVASISGPSSGQQQATRQYGRDF